MNLPFFTCQFQQPFKRYQQIMVKILLFILYSFLVCGKESPIISSKRITVVNFTETLLQNCPKSLIYEQLPRFCILTPIQHVIEVTYNSSYDFILPRKIYLNSCQGTCSHGGCNPASYEEKTFKVTRLKCQTHGNKCLRLCSNITVSHPTSCSCSLTSLDNKQQTGSAIQIENIVELPQLKLDILIYMGAFVLLVLIILFIFVIAAAVRVFIACSNYY